MDPVEQSVLGQLHKQLRVKMNDMADIISTGGARDWADYRHMVGMIDGLAHAERDLLELVERMTHED